jgi:hypothetical protein
VPERRYDLDIADETFVAAAHAAVAAEVHSPAAWSRWWPDLAAVVTRDRGLKGVQWAVTGALVGSMEIWLEPCGDGVVLHWFLRADRADQADRADTYDGAGGRGVVRRGVALVRRPGRETDRRVRAWKRHAFALKDRLETGREPGSRLAAEQPVKPAEVSADST